MYDASMDHGKIISAFLRCVPDAYVRDYRSNNGYITVARGYRNIKWRDQTTTYKVERQIPSVTLLNLPRGTVRPQSWFNGLRLERPGWRQEFRRASAHLTLNQMRRITRMLGVGEVFEGIR